MRTTNLVLLLLVLLAACKPSAAVAPITGISTLIPTLTPVAVPTETLTLMPASAPLPTSTPTSHPLPKPSDSGGGVIAYGFAPTSGQMQINVAADSEPSWSPDGKWIAFSSTRNGNVDIYILDVEEAIQSAGDVNVRRLTYHPGEDVGPVWMPAP